MDKPQYLNAVFKGFFQRLCLNAHRKIGIVVILHTFGKDMKFHPHLHILTNYNINFNFKFNALWKKIILCNLKLTSNKYYYGYYVWSDSIKSKNIAKYIGRYVRHPAIASGRVITYNKQHITFYYNNAKQRRVFIRKSIMDFITCLIQHIPPEQFKLIRICGLKPSHDSGVDVCPPCAQSASNKIA